MASGRATAPSPRSIHPPGGREEEAPSVRMIFQSRRLVPSSLAGEGQGEVGATRNRPDSPSKGHWPSRADSSTIARPPMGFRGGAMRLSTLLFAIMVFAFV